LIADFHGKVINPYIKPDPDTVPDAGEPVPLAPVATAFPSVEPTAASSGTLPAVTRGPGAAAPPSPPSPAMVAPSQASCPSPSEIGGAADGADAGVHVPRQTDGSVDPADLQLALLDANSKLSEAHRSQLWARMIRRTTSTSCPPLIKEKWAAAGKDRSRKNEVFGLFLACGGNVGKMEATEEIIRTDRKRTSDAKAWLTRVELQDKYKDTPTVDDLIARKTGNDVREHPDFPGNKAMHQYRVFDFSREQTDQTVAMPYIYWHFTSHTTAH
jgi:hypothetical protein